MMDQTTYNITDRTIQQMSRLSLFAGRVRPLQILEPDEEKNAMTTPIYHEKKNFHRCVSSLAMFGTNS